jgi:hypothetical protein
MDRLALIAFSFLMVVGRVNAQALPVDWYAKTGSSMTVANGTKEVVSVGKVASQTVSAAANNGAKLYAMRSISVGNAAGELALTRAVPASSLIAAGRALARLAGPVGLAIVGVQLGMWLWDEVEQRWYQKTKVELGCWSSNGSSCIDVDADCAARQQGGVDSAVRVNYVSSTKAVCQGFSPLYNWWYDKFTYSKLVTGEGEQIVYPTDADLEQAVETAMNNGTLHPHEIAERALANNVPIDPEPLQVTGPATLPGRSSTSVSTGPAGQTKTQTDTQYDLGYAGDKVSVGSQTTTTVTKPDGTTETTTDAEAGTGNDVDDAEDPDTGSDDESEFCAKNPNSISCQELGDPDDVDLPEQESSVLWNQEGSAAGQCPSPMAASMGGQHVELSWEPTCDFARGIRPIVIGLAWLSAGIFLFYVARGTR